MEQQGGKGSSFNSKDAGYEAYEAFVDCVISSLEN